MSHSTSRQSTVRPTVKDRLTLLLLKLAKLRRQPLERVADGDCEDFYNKFFVESDVESYERDRRMTLRRETINQHIAKYVSPPARVLDVGCGLGDVLAALPDGYELLGMDYAARNVSLASQRLRDRAKIRQGSVYELPYESGSVDACICLEVLEHIEDDARGVREIARVLRPGGILVASVPYNFYWPQYLALMGHFRHYSRQSFTALLEAAGFAIAAHLPNYPNWHQTYTRKYALLRAVAGTLGRPFGGSNIYTFRWPWRRQHSLDRLTQKLEWLRHRDASLDYSQLTTSTFLLARKGVA